MNLVDKVILEWSYKTKKGYPDLNNPEDLKLFESLFGFNLNEATAGEQALEIVKSKLGIDDSKVKRNSSKTFTILVPAAARYETIEKLETLDGFEYDPNVSGSSIGGMVYNGIKFLIKPEEKQGRASAGLDNEDVISQQIKDALGKGVKNVILNGENKDIIIKNVRKVVDSGYDVSGGKKADIVIHGDQKVPISIKKDNAGFWESADSRYKNVMKAFVKKVQSGHFAPEITFIPFVDKLGKTKRDIYNLYDAENETKLGGVVITDLPNKEEHSIIFGPDNAQVVYRTFRPSDFRTKGDTLYIDVSKILTDMADIEEYELQPVLKIRHDSTRTSQKGLRSVVQPYNKVYRDGEIAGNVKEIPFSDIM